MKRFTTKIYIIKRKKFFNLLSQIFANKFPEYAKIITGKYLMEERIMVSTILLCVQIFFTVMTGTYFMTLLRGQREQKTALAADSGEELAKLRKLDMIKLSVPLA